MEPYDLDFFTWYLCNRITKFTNSLLSLITLFTKHFCEGNFLVFIFKKKPLGFSTNYIFFVFFCFLYSPSFFTYLLPPLKEKEKESTRKNFVRLCEKSLQRVIPNKVAWSARFRVGRHCNMMSFDSIYKAYIMSKGSTTLD